MVKMLLLMLAVFMAASFAHAGLLQIYAISSPSGVGGRRQAYEMSHHSPPILV